MILFFLSLGLQCIARIRALFETDIFILKYFHIHYLASWCFIESQLSSYSLLMYLNKEIYPKFDLQVNPKTLPVTNTLAYSTPLTVATKSIL